jgi:hypothetical protein
MFERDWGNHAALWRSGVGVADAPVFQYASTQPFVDQVQQHIVTHPTSKKLSQVAVILSNVGLSLTDRSGNRNHPPGNSVPGGCCRSEIGGYN